jgi:tRNA(Arg) A34 adenosine deaminase TadA
MSLEHEKFMARAIELAQAGVDDDLGGPFGCVVVKDGEIVGEGNNRVTSTLDPTAHAEIVAIREACKNLNSFQLEDCVIYTSCEPCPMCLGAIYWARPTSIFIACNRQDAAEAGFDDEFIYEEISSPDFASRKVPISMLMREEGLAVFRNWIEKPDKIEY